MAVDAKTSLAQEIFPELQLTDRCDRCGARATSRAVFLEGELFFCGHHTNKYSEGLTKTARYLQETAPTS